MEFVLFLILTNLVVGLLGSTRRLGFWGAFFAAWVITPIGAALLVLASGKKRRRRLPKTSTQKVQIAS